MQFLTFNWIYLENCKCRLSSLLWPLNLNLLFFFFFFKSITSLWKVIAPWRWAQFPLDSVNHLAIANFSISVYGICYVSGLSAHAQELQINHETQCLVPGGAQEIGLSTTSVGPRGRFISSDPLCVVSSRHVVSVSGLQRQDLKQPNCGWSTFVSELFLWWNKTRTCTICVNIFTFSQSQPTVRLPAGV